MIYSKLIFCIANYIDFAPISQIAIGIYDYNI